MKRKSIIYCRLLQIFDYYKIENIEKRRKNKEADELIINMNKHIEEINDDDINYFFTNDKSCIMISIMMNKNHNMILTYKNQFSIDEIDDNFDYKSFLNEVIKDIKVF